MMTPNKVEVITQVEREHGSHKAVQLAPLSAAAFNVVAPSTLTEHESSKRNLTEVSSDHSMQVAVSNSMA